MSTNEKRFSNTTLPGGFVEKASNAPVEREMRAEGGPSVGAPLPAVEAARKLIADEGAPSDRRTPTPGK